MLAPCSCSAVRLDNIPNKGGRVRLEPKASKPSAPSTPHQAPRRLSENAPGQQSLAFNQRQQRQTERGNGQTHGDEPGFAQAFHHSANQTALHQNADQAAVNEEIRCHGGRGGIVVDIQAKVCANHQVRQCDLKTTKTQGGKEKPPPVGRCRVASKCAATGPDAGVAGTCSEPGWRLPGEWPGREESWPRRATAATQPWAGDAELLQAESTNRRAYNEAQAKGHADQAHPFERCAAGVMSAM
jgi:hypothetical protein